MPAATLMDQKEASVGAVDESIAPSETTEGSASNPRKRKKSSRACDFCHINHQPCDNAKPRCSYCERHGKSCLYLRPQKKRGPAQGYRSALHSMRESAAAWGAALNLIPSLGPVIEGYLQKEEGKRLIRAIKDPQQQEFFIQSWQQSSVFKSFFGDDESIDSGEAGGEAADAPYAPPEPSSNPAESTATSSAETIVASGQPPYHPAPPPTATGTDGKPPLDLFNISLQQPPPPLPHSSSSLSYAPHQHTPQQAHHQPTPLSYDAKLESLLHPHSGELSQPHDHSMLSSPDGMGSGLNDMHTSLSDIVARDAARATTSFSQTLGSLGFGPEETFNDFLNISYNLDPTDTTADQDPLLGSELDQKAYYELLMGRQFT
ncbi:quinic acid utilization activator [Sporothrix brasiliensis 5110]|uniref:Quinic acid utilization activator n=1 Tax=Sporothrix brasiliensis 5110 TaxID=1398154 RepID=A0A0C2F2A3_9PEZI|nr:quinic acid utilization activator [Sporothrix brasiliensis 5110]KIH93049.1 quinic acid utilization activator [Sporothrix brasiliensis 5110]